MKNVWESGKMFTYSTYRVKNRNILLVKKVWCHHPTSPRIYTYIKPLSNQRESTGKKVQSEHPYVLWPLVRNFRSLWPIDFLHLIYIINTSQQKKKKPRLPFIMIRSLSGVRIPVDDKNSPVKNVHVPKWPEENIIIVLYFPWSYLLLEVFPSVHSFGIWTFLPRTFLHGHYYYPSLACACLFIIITRLHTI